LSEIKQTKPNLWRFKQLKFAADLPPCYGMCGSF